MADPILAPKDFNQAGEPLVWLGDQDGLTPNWPDDPELTITAGLDKNIYLSPTGTLTFHGITARETQIRHALLTMDMEAYNIVETEFDVNSVPEGYRPGIRHILDAFDAVNELYWLMRYSNYGEIRQTIEGSGDEIARRHFAFLGPRCQTIEHELCFSQNTIPLNELESLKGGAQGLIDKLSKEDPNHPITSRYTAVVSASEGEEGAVEYEGGWYRALPYNKDTVFQPIMEGIAHHLQEAARDLAGLDPLLSDQCTNLAKVYREWKLPLPFEGSHLSWLKAVDSNGPFMLIMSVEWAYQGQGKALPTAALLQRSAGGVEKTRAFVDYSQEIHRAALALFSKELQKLIPQEIEAPHIQFGNVIYAAGDYTSPEYMPGGCQLPNDGMLAKSGSTILTYFQNWFQARQKKEAGAVASVLTPPSLLNLATDESDAIMAMGHEVSHSLLIHDETPINESTRGKVLGNIYIAFEEAKADLLGRFATHLLQKKGLFSKKLVMADAVSWLKNLERNLYKGYCAAVKDPIEMDGHFSGAYLEFAAALKYGILKVSDTGKIQLDFEMLEKNVGNLLVEVATPYIETGKDRDKSKDADDKDKARCAEKIKEAVASLPPSIKARFEDVKKAKIPTRSRARFNVKNR